MITLPATSVLASHLKYIGHLHELDTYNISNMYIATRLSVISKFKHIIRKDLQRAIEYIFNSLLLTQTMSSQRKGLKTTKISFAA